MNHSEQDFWLRRFDQEDVQFVVLNQSQDKKLVQTLRRAQEWSVDFEGNGAVIFVRSAQNGEQR
jgi:hypothetical protein